MDCSPKGSPVHGISGKDTDGLPFPPPGDLPDLEIEPTSPALAASALPLSHQGSPLCFT